MKKTNYTFDPFLPRTNKQLIFFMLQPFKVRFTGFFILTFLGVFCWNASSYIASRLITDLSEKGTVTDTAWKFVILYGFLRLGDELFWRSGEALMRTIKPQMIERVRTSIFAKILQRPHSFFVNSSSGRISHWVTQATNSANKVVDNTIWGAWGEMLGLVLSAFFLATVHWSLAALFSVWLILLFWYNIKRGRKFSELIAKQSDNESIAASITVDVIANNSNMRMFNAREQEISRLYEQQQHIIHWWRVSWTYNLITNIVKGQSTAIVNVLALSSALVLFANGQIPIGGVVLFLAYFNAASSGLWNLVWNLDEYYRLFGAMQNSLDGLQGEEERTGEVVEVKDLPKRVDLHIDKLSFCYPEQPDNAVLDNITISIKKGEKVGIVGHSGAGKSTLIGLLLGFYAPSGGKILVNGLDAGEKDPSFIRAVSAYVPQDTSMFNRTVRENILYARPKASEKEVLRAIKLAHADDFIAKLPQGLDTLVGERGVKLSGGQRQRIAIARAILKDAPLLLLDEATSALDSVSEQAIQKALHELMKGRTAVVIAHRLSTLKHLDKIVVIEKGVVVESGAHDELLQITNGMYADLWRRQKDGFIVE